MEQPQHPRQRTRVYRAVRSARCRRGQSQKYGCDETDIYLWVQVPNHRSRFYFVTTAPGRLYITVKPGVTDAAMQGRTLFAHKMEGFTMTESTPHGHP
jgi:hypothetical protein